MLSGPSALIAVEGRIEPVSTTGLSLFTTRSRKYEVSSIVSVPCVTATPAMSGFASSSLIRLPSLSHTASFMSWLPMLAICSPVTSAMSLSCGTAWISRSTPTAPDWYPASVAAAAAPAMVPPVATITTLGLATAAVAASKPVASTATILWLLMALFSDLSLTSRGLLLLVFAGVEIGELRRIEQILDLSLGEDVLLANDLENALAALVGLVGELGRLVVADDRVERGDDADRGFHVVLEHLLVHRDAVDAAGAEELGDVEQQMLRFDVRESIQRLVGVELQLPAVRRQRHRGVVGDHPEGHDADHLGNHRIDLAGHDRRTR